MPSILPVIQSSLSLILFILRIIVPITCVIIVSKCFTSLKRGRRRESPVIILEDVINHRIIPVLYWENSLGRSKSSDIVLNDMTASRSHAVLMRRESGWMITDTGSKSGTFVNGTKIKDSSPVFPGDTIAMGSSALMLKPAGQPGQEMPVRRVQRVASPFGLLAAVTLVQILITVQACLAGGKFNYIPCIPFAGMFVLEWLMFFTP